MIKLLGELINHTQYTKNENLHMVFYATKKSKQSIFSSLMETHEQDRNFTFEIQKLTLKSVLFTCSNMRAGVRDCKKEGTGVRNQFKSNITARLGLPASMLRYRCAVILALYMGLYFTQTSKSLKAFVYGFAICVTSSYNVLFCLVYRSI